MPHATASTISLLQRTRLEDRQASQPRFDGHSVKAAYSSHVALCKCLFASCRARRNRNTTALLAVVALADRTPPATQPTGLDRFTGARTGIVLLTKITVRQARAFARIFLFAPLRFDQPRADVGDQVQS